MSAPRILKFFQALPSQLKSLGGYSFDINAVVIWQGEITSGPYAGSMACVIDTTSATWADGNNRAVIVAAPGEASLPLTMVTQSHSAGQYLNGSFNFKVYVETPESWTGDQAKWQRILTHELLGQNGAPTELFFGANDVQPIVEGVQGGTSGQEATSTFVSAGQLRPYALSYTGGI